MTRHTYRFFAQDVTDGLATLAPADRHHLEHVLRLRVGDTCEVAAGGRVHEARVVSGGLELVKEIAAVALVVILARLPAAERRATAL